MKVFINNLKLLREAATVDNPTISNLEIQVSKATLAKNESDTHVLTDIDNQWQVFKKQIFPALYGAIDRASAQGQYQVTFGIPPEFECITIRLIDHLESKSEGFKTYMFNPAMLHVRW
jgi:hypothetical protein